MTALARYVAPGSAAAYDDLTQAVDTFTGDFTALRAAAINCGMPAGERDLVAWLKRRLGTYRQTTGRADRELSAAMVCAAYATTRDGPDFHIASKEA